MQSFKNNTHIYLIKLSTAAGAKKPAQTSLHLSRNTRYYNKLFKRTKPKPAIYLIQRGNQNKTSSQESLHTLILKALLNPLAKNPPNGPINEANVDSAMLCI